MSVPFSLKTISAKNLGYFAMPDMCPLCLWRKARLGFNGPWSVFPGIFSVIDGYSKDITTQHIKSAGVVPSWLTKFGELKEQMPCPHWSKFSVLDANSGVTCRGTPDEMFRLVDGTIAILDYKTAKFSEGQDKMLPIYEVQLSAYAWIAKSIGLGSTSAAGLVYYEPRGEVTPEDIMTGGFSMDFSAHILPIRVNIDNIPVLLARAKHLVEEVDAPKGVSGCKDCSKIAELKSME